MKNLNKISYAMTHVLRVVIFSMLFLALNNVSEASHFRYGTMSWEQVSGNTYRITVSQAWRKSFFPGVVQGGTVETGTLNLGDGTTTQVQLSVTSINPTDDWFYGQFIYTKTYPSTPAVRDYNVTFTGCCRLSTLRNAADGDYLSASKINVGTTNNSPIVTIDPIKTAQINTLTTFQVSNFDPDGDAVTYRLATAAEMGATNYILPAGTTINAATGEVTFNGSGKLLNSQYALGIVVSDGKTSVLVDLLVTMVAQSTPPQFDYSVTPVNAHVFQIAPGQNLSFGVKAFDSDPGSIVSLGAVGLPIGSTFPTATPANPVATTFSWTPTATQFGTFVVNFTATDNANVQTPTFITIVVSLKPIFDVPPTPAFGIELATEPGTPFQFVVQASDPDPLDVVQLTDVINKPATATLTPMPSSAGNPTTANFTWNPAVSDWGEREIQFEATDSYGDKAYHKIALIVNTPPVFTSTPPASSIVINQPYVYEITGLDPDLPYGDVVELIGNSIPSWLTLVDNGDGTGSLTGTPSIADAGTYTITLYLEDIYHHSGHHGVPSQTVTITVIPCTIALDSIHVSNVSCNGAANGRAEVLFTGGFGPFTYQWSNGSTDSILVAGPGIYNVVVTDVYNCSISGSVQITEPAPLVITGSTSDYNGFGVSCYGRMNGSATITATGGTQAYNTYWSTGSTGFSITGLSAGNYTAHVVDANGCVDSLVVTITEPTRVTASLSGATNVSCFGGSNGSAAIAVTGGIPAYNTIWSTGSAALTISGVPAGTYVARVTDVNGCADSVFVTITEPTKVVATLSGVTNVSCFGGANGSAAVTVTGGTPAYNTIWSTGSTALSVSGLSAGVYGAHVTDANGCADSVFVTITEPTKVVASISGVTNVACFGGANGSAIAAATGGVAPYTYLWSNGSTAKTATGLSAIGYSVVVTDLNNCPSTASVVITSPAKVVASITSPAVIGSYNTSCSLDGDGIATVAGTGGVLPYTTSWNTGATSTSISGLLAGTYSATLTDNNGCTATSSITLTKPENCNCVTAPIAPTVSCAAYPKVLDGQSNAIVNAGDNASVVNTFTGNINMNGGNLIICGNANLQWLNIPNNSKVTVLGTLTLNGINFNGTNAVLENFGTIVINGSLNVAGKLTNNKTFTVKQGANFNSGSYVVNNGTLSVVSDLNNNSYFANNGLLSVGNTIYNNSNSTMLNNCTTKSRSYFVNSNVDFANNGTLDVANDIRFNNAKGSIASGSIVRTKDAYVNGTTLSGANAACALISVSSYTQINQASLNGKISLCDVNGFEIKNNLVLVSGANTNCTTCNYSGTPVASNLRDADADALATVQVDNALTMYPNPVSNGAEVTISSSVEIVSTTVFDNLGRAVLTTSGPVFNVSDLSTGIYLVKIEDVLGNITTTKLVVK